MPVKHIEFHPGDDLGPANRTLGIFLVSVLGLFLEMLFIRWVGTEIRLFAYLQNVILVVCFLGLGLGCFTSRRPIKIRRALIPLFILVLLLAIPLTRRGLGIISELLSVLGDLVIWYSLDGVTFWQSVLFVILGLGLAYLVLVLVVDAFIPIGRLLGRLMDEHPHTIKAYSVNIAGSLVGTWLFVLISFFYQPPFTWFAPGGVCLFLPGAGWPRSVDQPCSSCEHCSPLLVCWAGIGLSRRCLVALSKARGQPV